MTPRHVKRRAAPAPPARLPRRVKPQQSVPGKEKHRQLRGCSSEAAALLPALGGRLSGEESLGWGEERMG